MTVLYAGCWGAVSSVIVSSLEGEGCKGSLGGGGGGGGIVMTVSIVGNGIELNTSLLGQVTRRLSTFLRSSTPPSVLNRHADEARLR